VRQTRFVSRKAKPRGLCGVRSILLASSFISSYFCRLQFRLQSIKSDIQRRSIGVDIKPTLLLIAFEIANSIIAYVFGFRFARFLLTGDLEGKTQNSEMATLVASMWRSTVIATFVRFVSIGCIALCCVFNRFQMKTAAAGSWIAFLTIYGLFLLFVGTDFRSNYSKGSAILERAFELTHSSAVNELRKKTITEAAGVARVLYFFEFVFLLQAWVPFFWGYFDLWFPIFQALGIGSVVLMMAKLLPNPDEDGKRAWKGQVTVIEDAHEAIEPVSGTDYSQATSAHSF